VSVTKPSDVVNADRRTSTCAFTQVSVFRSLVGWLVPYSFIHVPLQKQYTSRQE